MTDPDQTASGKDLESRLAAVVELRKLQGPAPLPQLAAALRDPDIAVAKIALTGLIDRKAHVGPLRELLNDPDPAMRWRACTLAWWFHLKELAGQLTAALTDDSEPMVRAEAAWGLQCSDDDAAAEALARACRDHNRYVAHYAAWNLRVLAAHNPLLPSLAGKKIEPPPLLPERPGRAHRPAAAKRGVPRPGTPSRLSAEEAAAFEQFAFSVPLPACRAPLADEPTTIDGELKGCYGQGDSLQFMDAWPARPSRGTAFRAACSSDTLYLHIRCQFAGQEELAARCTADGPGVFADNCVEVFLDPTGQGVGPCHHLCINTANARCFLRSPSPHWHVWQPEGLRDEPWQPKATRTAVKVEDGFWNAELAIPFADLGLEAAKLNKLWRLNVVRSAHLAEGGEVTSWCDLGGCDAHRPELFGYLWLDAGRVMNADASVFQAKLLPVSDELKGWTILRGRFAVADGTVEALDGSSALRWDEPLGFEQFEVSAEVQLRHQVRFMFAADADNSVLGFDGAYLRMINEAHFAHCKGWRDWAPALPGVLTIYKEVYPRLTHSRWYQAAIRILRERCQLLLDGAVCIEMPRPAMPARHFGLAFAGGGKVRKLRFAPL